LTNQRQRSGAAPVSRAIRRYDLFNKTRSIPTASKNIAIIGINTFGWAFADRGIEPPGIRPNVRPSNVT